MDPCLVLSDGTSTNANWWQTWSSSNPDRYALKPSRSPSEPWFFQAPLPANESTVTEAEFIDDGGRRSLKHDVSKSTLKRCYTLHDIGEWIRQEGITIGMTEGAAIQSQVLSPDFAVEDVAAYISDPMFHPPGSSFISTLLLQTLSRTWDPRCWAQVRSSICEATRLGLISTDDLRKLLVQILESPQIKIRTSPTRVEVVHRREALCLIQGILSSLWTSDILNVADLGGDHLSTILSKLVKLGNVDASEVGRNILRYLLPWVQEEHAPLITRVVRRRCRELTSDEESNTLVAELCLIRKPLPQILLQTTESIMASAQRLVCTGQNRLFNNWTNVLQILGTRKRRPLFRDAEWSKLVARPSTLSVEQRFLGFAWTTLVLGEHIQTSAQLQDRLDFLKRLEKMLASKPEAATLGFYRRCLIVLEHTFLPVKHIVRRQIQRLDERHGLARSAHTSTVSELVGEDLSGFSMFFNPSSLEELPSRDLQSLQMLSDALVGDISVFKVMSRRIIRKNALSFGLISNILRSNMVVKLIMSQSRRLPLEQQVYPPTPMPSVANPKEQDPLQCQVTRLTEHLPSSKQVLDLIDHLAVSFATSPVTTARSARQRVLWCYNLLHRYGAPSSSLMTKALWYTGVTRYGEQGTPRKILQWTWERVKETEGEAVASYLLWSEALREQWRHEVEMLGHFDAQEEEKVLNEMNKEHQIAMPGLGVPRREDFESLSDIFFVKDNPPIPRTYSVEDINSKSRRVKARRQNAGQKGRRGVRASLRR